MILFVQIQATLWNNLGQKKLTNFAVRLIVRKVKKANEIMVSKNIQSKHLLNDN